MKTKKTEISQLEDIYRQYLVPMSEEKWSKTRSLKQPNMLKVVPIKTSSSLSREDLL